MLPQLWMWTTALVLGTVLATGCRALPWRHSPSPDASPSAIAKSEATDELTTRKRAEAHAHYAVGVIHEMNDELEPALQEYYKAAIGDPETESLVLEVSRRFLQNKQPEKALELLKRAGARPNASGAIYARLSMVYSQLGKYEEATVAGRTAIKKSPGALAGYQNLFVTYLQNKQPQEAVKVLDDAAKQSDADAEFLIGLSELYANLGRQVPTQKEHTDAKALLSLKRAEKLEPASTPLRMKLADGFNLLGDSGRAAQLYLELLNKLPDVPAIRDRIRAKLAEIYLRGEDRKRAAEQLEAIIRDDPTNPQAYYYLGSIAFEQKKTAEAADHFSKTILLNPEFEQAYYDLASAQINLNKSSEALATLEKARKKFSQNFVLEFLTGMALSRDKSYAEAIRHYVAAEVVAKATEPKRLNQFFYFQLGSACERTSDHAQAEKYFEKCLELAPDFAEALNYLGYMWAEHGTNLLKARQLIEHALKLEPKNAAYLDSMGWVLFKLNQPQEALPYVLQAAGLIEEPDATVYDHLGDIYAALSQKDKARDAWRKSLSVESNDEVRKKLESASPP